MSTYSPEYNHEYYLKHREKRLLDAKERYQTDKTEKCQHQRGYYQKTRDTRLEYGQNYRRENADVLAHYAKEYREKYKAERQVTWTARSKESHRKLRLELLQHYGSKCACCSEDTMQFLAIDHVDGGGSKHRLTRGSQIYRDIKLAGFPPNYQVLCHNCNMAKGLYGECPHLSLMREVGGLA